MPVRLSRRKRILFSVGVALMLYVLVEGGSALLIALKYGGLSNLWSEHDRMAATDTDNSDDGRDRDAAQTFLGEKVRPDMIHPYSGYVRQPPPPDSSIRLKHEVNEYGFNDTQPPLRHRAPDKVIVGIVGGSVAEQFATNACDALAAELSESPRFAGKKFEFARLALRGYKQPQQLMTMNYLLTLGAEFDILINLDGFNEVALPIAENVPDQVFPSFPRKWHARIANLRNPAVSRLIGEAEYLKGRQQRQAKRFARRPFCYSPTWTLLWKIRSDWQGREILELQEEVDVLARDEAAYGATGPKFSFATDAELHKHCVEVWSRSSLLLNQLCQANDIAYYHFLQPNQYVSGSKPMDKPEQAVALNAENPYRAPAIAGYPLLIAEGKTLNEKGVHFHDLTRVFADHPESLYVDDCCHFSDQGDKILAHEIASAIRSDHERRTSDRP